MIFSFKSGRWRNFFSPCFSPFLALNKRAKALLALLVLCKRGNRSKERIALSLSKNKFFERKNNQRANSQPWLFCLHIISLSQNCCCHIIPCSPSSPSSSPPTKSFQIFFVQLKSFYLTPISEYFYCTHC